MELGSNARVRRLSWAAMSASDAYINMGRQLAVRYNAYDSAAKALFDKYMQAQETGTEVLRIHLPPIRTRDQSLPAQSVETRLDLSPAQISGVCRLVLEGSRRERRGKRQVFHRVIAGRGVNQAQQRSMGGGSRERPEQRYYTDSAGWWDQDPYSSGLAVTAITFLVH